MNYDIMGIYYIVATSKLGCLLVGFPPVAGFAAGVTVLKNSFEAEGYTGQPEALLTAVAITALGWSLETLAGVVLTKRSSNKKY